MNDLKTGITALLLAGSPLLSAQSAMAADGVAVNHLGVNNTLVRVDSEKKYVLMPVQESNDDATINVLVDGKLEKTIYVRLAKSKVDYYVPFDLSAYKGHEVVLNVVTSQSRSTVREAKEDACWSRFCVADTFDTANREKYREYYQGKYSLTDAQMQQYEEEQLALAARWSQPNRESIAALCRARKIALASHDDATHAHVAESHQLGSVIAEFPTTFEAAEASRKHGMNVLMGAPNIVRGGSHSGNVAASELAQLGLLDILSSDYYPASLLDAAFRVADDQSNRFTLPQAVKLVTKNPAQALNLQDRGVIGEGKRADLVLAHRKDNHIHIDHVWRQGKRVF